jgi:DNA-binding transcriptional ArsR family regulator
MDVKAFAASAPEMSEFVKSLANPVRLRILCALSARELSVGALSAAIGVSMPTMSQHLALLRKDRLVSCRRANQSVVYALADAKVASVIRGLTKEFCHVATRGDRPLTKP